jgi:hypothetical protein
MASFSAELHVAGHVFPVTHCLFDVTQATQLRGRVSAKVRYGPVQLVLDVPDGDVLPSWAAEAQKCQATSVVFLDANGGLAVETLHLPAAYCVAYQEQFVSGDGQSGAYQCFLTLSDPSGWTITSGGPAGSFVAPAARDHGVPMAAVVVASGLRNMTIGGAMAAPRTLVDPADIPPHLPAPQPNPSPDYAQVHVSQAEWAALIKGRWERNESSKKKKFTFLQQHRNTEFHVAGDPFTYRVGANCKMEAVYDAQTQKSYNITGTRKGFARIPLTLNGEPTYAGTEHMYPVTGNQRNVVQIQMTGSRDGDFKAANEAAGLADVVRTQGRRPERAPEGYTWHHRADFIPTTGTPPPYGTCTMELVKDKAHRGTLEHFGSCDQCNKYTGLTLYK